MTLVTVDITGVASSTGPNDRVVLRAPMIREKTGGGLVDTREEVVHLTQGVGEVNLEPGPVMVKFLCEGVSDTREKMGVVPEGEGPIDIFDVLSDSLDYPAPVVGAAQAASAIAQESARVAKRSEQLAVESAGISVESRDRVVGDRIAAERAAADAGESAWRAHMTTVGVNITPSILGEGIYIIGTEHLAITELPDDTGLYTIGVI